jgi:hypothetical protein
LGDKVITRVGGRGECLATTAIVVALLISIIAGLIGLFTRSG